MPMPAQTRSVRFRLIALVVASTLPMLLFAVIMVALFDRQQRALLEGSFRDTARALTVAVDQELNASISTLGALATSRDLDTGDLRGFYDEAGRVLRARPAWSTINLFDHTGQQLFNLALPFGAPLPDSRGLVDVQQAIVTGRPAVSDLFVGLVLKTPVVGIAVPVTREDRLKYVIGARLNLQLLSQLLSAGGLPAESVATLIDRKGTIVARTRGIEQLLGTPATPKFVSLGQGPVSQGSFQDITRDGVSVYGAYSRSVLSGWTVGIGVPAATVDAPRRTSLWAAAGGGLVLLLVGAGLALGVGRRIAGAITSLADTAGALAAGDAPAGRRVSWIAEVDRVDAALRESAERTRLIVAHALDAVITIDVEGRVTSWNPQAEAIFGWPAEAVQGRLLSETIIPPAHRAAHERGLARFRETGEGPVLGRRLELTGLRRDGVEIPVELAITPMRVGGAPGFSAFLRDITERKRAELALATSAQRLRILHAIDAAIIAAAAPAAIAAAVLEPLRDLLGVSRAIVNLFDLEAGEVEWLAAIGRRRLHTGPGVRYSLDLMGDVEALRRGEVQVIDTRALAPGPAVQALLDSGIDAYMVVPMIAEGELIGGLSFGGGPREYSAEQLGIAREVAAQLAIALAQARLRERVTAAEQQYRGIFENAVEGIFRSTLEGRHLLVNPAMARIYGYDSPADMLASVADIERQLYVDPEERRALLRQLDHDGVVTRFECQGRRKDGEVIWVSQSVRGVRDEAGRVLYFEGVLEDITERKRTEEALRQSEKLAAISSLVAGVAHELNNPLSVIIAHSTMLAQSRPGNAEQRAAKIVEAAERCARLVKNFLALARRHPPERRRVSLNQIVSETVELLAYPFRVDGVTVTVDLAPELPPLWADPHQLQQVVLNLLTNAHHAVRGLSSERRVTVRTRLEADGRRVSVMVADTGPGIPPALQRRLFEPFFTTKPTGQGTGLGLSLCRGIVESHGGVISAEGHPGTGAVFTVVLPVTEIPAAPEPVALAPPPSRSCHILIVDDEPEVAEVLAELLAIDGHQSEIAANGAIALERLRQSAPDLIISDLRMPVLDGPGLYRALEASGHALRHRFVFITGDVLSPQTRAFLERSQVPALAKPYVLADVRSVLSQILGRPPAA